MFQRNQILFDEVKCAVHKYQIFLRYSEKEFFEETVEKIRFEKYEIRGRG